MRYSKSVEKHQSRFVDLGKISIDKLIKAIVIYLKHLNSKMMERESDQARERLTNCVLYEDGKENILYLPAYLRIKIKNFTEMDLEQLKAEMNSTFIFSVFYGDIEDKIGKEGLDKVMSGIVWTFNRDDALELTEKL